MLSTVTLAQTLNSSFFVVGVNVYLFGLLFCQVDLNGTNFLHHLKLSLHLYLDLYHLGFSHYLCLFCHSINLYQPEFAGKDIFVAFVLSQSATCFVQIFVSVQAFFWINSTLWSFFQDATSFVSLFKVCQKVKLFASNVHPESSFFHPENLYQVLVGSPGSLVTVRQLL